MVFQGDVEQVENPFREKESLQRLTSTAPSSIPHPDPGSLADGDDELFPVPSLSLREMTGFEEEFIEGHGQNSNTVRLVNEVLARCLVKPGEEPGIERETIKNLLVTDRDAALIRLRQNSIGDEISTETSCPKCGTGNAVNFRLSSLPIEFKRPPKQLRVDLPDGRIALLRLPTAGDQEALFEANLNGESQYRSWLLARLLLKFGADEGPFDLAFTRSLPLSIRAALETRLNAAIPALDLTMGVTCYACNEAFTVPFDVPSFFFSN